MKTILYFALAIAVGLSMTSDSFAQGKRPGSDRGGKAGERPGGQRGGQRAQRGERGQDQGSKPTPVALKDGVATLSPENTKVSFVGTHVGEDPKPRLGGFKKFSGKLKTTEDGKSIQSLTMEFETNSLFTELGANLTDHLKNADFLDVEKFPSAKFVSTEVKAGEKEGTLNVVGDFTLMGKTNSITIPVTMKSGEAGILAKGALKLDRTSFGMSKMTERVSKEVAITLAVGEKTGGNTASGQARGGPRGGGQRGGFDPAAFLKGMDKDGDGKLAGDEIPERMRARFDAMDSDGDKAITLEEFQKAMQNRGGGRGQGGGDRKGGRPGSDAGK